MENSISTAGRKVTDDAQWWTTARRTYTLMILCLIGIFNFLDRQILAILLEPIKQDMHVSDTMMGLLSGIAFSAVYACAGIPIARMVDTGSRRWLLSICLTVWSASTVLCGAASSFFQLALARIGVATGEAGGNPASQSIMTDLYPPNRRGSIIGVLYAAQAIGIAMGLFLGGWLNSVIGWRAAFVIVGAPGILLAIITVLTLREPPRGMSEPMSARHTGASPSLAEGMRMAIREPALRILVVIAMSSSFAGFSILNWGPTFYLRVHGMTTMEVGLWMGIAVAGGFFLANILSGYLADRLSDGDLSNYMKIAGLGPSLAAPAALVFVLADSVTISLIALFFANLLMTVWLAPTTAVALSLSPPRNRGVMSAFMGFATTLIGAGLGPVFVGIMNDVFTPQYGDFAIRYSLLLVTGCFLVCGLLCFAAVKPVRRAAHAIQLSDTETAM